MVLSKNPRNFKIMYFCIVKFQIIFIVGLLEDSVLGWLLAFGLSWIRLIDKEYIVLSVEVGNCG